MGIYRMGPPEDLILKLSAAFAVENFVETGTFEGGTAVWAARHFKKVSTIERSEYFFEKTRKLYEKFENIDFIFGDSRTELENIVKNTRGASVFWLDAHWSGGATYGGDDQCPILEEIKIINSSKHENFIFIDDARLFTSPPPPPHKIEQWSDVSAIVNILQMIEKNRYIVIIEDVIIAVPDFAKSSVAQYCQEINFKLWKDYSDRINKSNIRKGAELIYADLPSPLAGGIKSVRQIFDLIAAKVSRK